MVRLEDLIMAYFNSVWRSVGRSVGGVVRATPIFVVDPDAGYLVQDGEILDVKVHGFKHILIDFTPIPDGTTIVTQPEPTWSEFASRQSDALREYRRPEPTPPPPEERGVAKVASPPSVKELRKWGDPVEAKSTMETIVNSVEKVVVAQGALPARYHPPPRNVEVVHHNLSRPDPNSPKYSGVRENPVTAISRIYPPSERAKRHATVDPIKNFVDEVSRGLEDTLKVVSAVNSVADRPTVEVRPTPVTVPLATRHPGLYVNEPVKGEVDINVKVPNPDTLRREVGPPPERVELPTPTPPVPVPPPPTVPPAPPTPPPRLPAVPPVAPPTPPALPPPTAPPARPPVAVPRVPPPITAPVRLEEIPSPHPRVLTPRVVYEVPRVKPTEVVKVTIPVTEGIRREVNRAVAETVTRVGRLVSWFVREHSRGNPIPREHVEEVRRTITRFGRLLEKLYNEARVPPTPPRPPRRPVTIPPPVRPPYTPVERRYPVIVVHTTYGPEYICPICGSAFYSLRALEEHMEIYHHGRPIYP